MSELCPVLLCGGSGTRLWPLSRTQYPKQFMDIGGKTLFGDTVQRAVTLPGAGIPLVVCGEDTRFLSAATLQALGITARILLEPLPRNTAPAIALAALAACETEGDPLLLVLPCDHAITPQSAFAATVEAATDCARQGWLVTFGVTPDKPETGYGYIRRGTPLGQGFTVANFVEKPDLETAQSLLAAGDCFWNSGMFLFRASLYLRELQTRAPDMYAACTAAYAAKSTDADFVRVPRDLFAASPANSIDYAIMERTDRAAMVPLTAIWSDLGSWDSIHALADKDEAGNACIGDVISVDNHDCYLHGTRRLVAALGLTNLVVVETGDAVLVADRARSQEVKQIIARLGATQRAEKDTHLKVFRPWGNYEILARGARFQVKRIVVSPGAELSLQLHHHRAEQWVVVSGTARVTVDGVTRLLKEDESTYIPLGSQHRLENPGRIPLAIIEIQTGSYLGEDDIVRFEDVYGR